MRLVQLSDPHLFANEQQRLRGVPTRASLRAVLRSLGPTDLDCRLCIVTGDVAHDERTQTYEALRGLLTPFEGRLRVLPGNHDDPDAMRSVFGDLFDATAPKLAFCDVFDDVVIIGLDSHEPAQAGGRVGPAQLQWLEDRLRAQPNHEVLVFVHHPPVPVGSPWLDGMGLADGAALLELLAAYPKVRAVMHGHTHQASHHAGPVNVYGAPSTAFQFAPGSSALELDPQPPGYRRVTLDAGVLRTKVVRLPVLEYPPILKV